MISAEPSQPGEKFSRLVDIMAKLRSPEGCPWDREQDFDSLKKYLIEEGYEVLECIDNRDWRGLSEELGDLLLQPVFLAQMASEENLFSIGDALDAINNKLVRRHPHVFGDAEAKTASEVKHRWDLIKEEEKRERGESPQALLDSVPRALPALVEAQEIGVKAAKVGFDWPAAEPVFDKLDEEISELRRAGAREQRIEELGDLLFAVVNLARKMGIDAEQALRAGNAKFRRRFAHLERALAAEGRPLGQASLDQMEEKWQEAKRIL